MNDHRAQFTFYESFKLAAKRLKKKADRADFYDFISDYALYGTMPDLEQASDAVAMAFELIRPVLDSGRRKARSGRAGGTVKQSESKSGAKGKQRPSGGEAEEKQTAREKEGEVEVEIEGEKENESSLYPPSMASPLGAAKEMFEIPNFEQVLTEAQVRGIPELAKPFFDYYSAAGWRDSEGKPVRSWRQKLVAWKVRDDDKLRKRSGKKAGPGAGDTVPQSDGKADQRAREDSERLREWLRTEKEKEGREQGG